MLLLFLPIVLRELVIEYHEIMCCETNRIDQIGWKLLIFWVDKFLSNKEFFVSFCFSHSYFKNFIMPILL